MREKGGNGEESAVLSSSVLICPVVGTVEGLGGDLPTHTRTRRTHYRNNCIH
jgi:hypothetical protein